MNKKKIRMFLSHDLKKHERSNKKLDFKVSPIKMKRENHPHFIEGPSMLTSKKRKRSGSRKKYESSKNRKSSKDRNISKIKNRKNLNKLKKETS